MKENYTNFATSALASPSPLTSTGLIFTVTSGQGALFPTANFIVTIDIEILFISSRSGDTFTVLTRGFNGTAAATHTVGATVQNSVTQYSFDHLWQNQPDAYHPDIPPLHLGNTPSQWDNEFENIGGWTLYPTSVPTGAAFNIGTSMRSHLYFRRTGGADNQLYSAYIPFSPPANTPYTVTMKLSESLNVPQNVAQNVETHFFVTDQTNPTAGPDTGNRIRMDTVLNAASSNNAMSALSRYTRGSHTVNGTWGQSGPAMPLAVNAPTYLRITTDGNGSWSMFAGDGYTFWLTGTFGGFNFTPRTLGIQFAAYPSGGFTVMHAAVVDWVRVSMSAYLDYLAM